jgi:hypothetical protein
MSEHLRKSIQELQMKLKQQLAEADKTKQAINSLYEILGEKPPYQIGKFQIAEVATLRPDSFFGKGLATAVGEYLEMRGHAVPVIDIMNGLQQGGYDFGNAKFPERVLRINLAKNTVKFVQIKGSDSFGLRKWYPAFQKVEKNAEPGPETENDRQSNQTPPIPPPPKDEEENK